MESLDQEVKKIDFAAYPYFYLKSSDGGPIFKMHSKALYHLSTFMQINMDNIAAEGSNLGFIEDNPQVLQTVVMDNDMNQPSETKEDNVFYFSKKFLINTSDHLAVITEYINSWGDGYSSAAYVDPKNERDDSSLEKALGEVHKNDIQLITKYVADEIKKLPEKAHKQMKKHPEWKKLYNVAVVNPLLETVEKYFQIESLADKFYVHMAVVFNLCSLVDISAITEIPVFGNVHNEIVEEWNLEHKEQIEKMQEMERIGEAKAREQIQKARAMEKEFLAKHSDKLEKLGQNINDFDHDIDDDFKEVLAPTTTKSEKVQASDTESTNDEDTEHED